MALKSSQPKKGKGCLKIFLIILFSPIILVLGAMAVTIIASIIQNKSDAEVLKSYKPTVEIAEIAEKNTLTDKGKATLYRSDPKLVDAQSFMKSCRTKARGTEPLACIASKPGGGPFGGRQIFMLQIDDPRFADHKYAAAIHEMLHGAYDRLGSDEKKRLNELLDQEFSKHQDDSYLKQVADALKGSKSNSMKEFQSELHSKFGVEFENLSPELEGYYRQYFADRSQVVSLFKNGGFSSRTARMDEISYQMKSLAPQITAYQQAGDAVNYNSLVGQYNSLAAESQGIYSEIKQFYQYFNPDYKPSEEKVQ